MNLKEIDQKSPFRGLIGHGNSYMDYFFANYKIFRRHAIPHEFAVSVKSTIQKDRDFVILHLIFQVHALLVT